MNPNEILPLTEPSLALSIYDKVFSARSGHEIIFTPQISRRGIIFPIDFVLMGQYLDAFVAAVSGIKEGSFYLSMTERAEVGYGPLNGHEKEFNQAIREGKPGSANPFAERITTFINDWFCPLDAVNAFFTRDPIQDKPFHYLDNAIYSVNGTCGLWFSNDGYAIIGGPEEFINTFYAGIDKTNEKMAVEFIKGMSNHRAAMEYLQSLFGGEEAEKYIQLYRGSFMDTCKRRNAPRATPFALAKFFFERFKLFYFPLHL